MAEKSICSIQGCDKAHEAKGLCNAHYRRLRKHGDPLAGRTSEGEPERFYKKVVLNYDGDDCLIWPFSKNGDGYGKLRIDGKNRPVHRLVCEELNGPPPTPEHQGSHLCGKGHLGCVTKRHLAWKTPKENQADRIIHGTHNRGERQGRAKLTERDALGILSLNGIEPRQSIASRYGVTRQAIADIHNGKSWGWLNQ